MLLIDIGRNAYGSNPLRQYEMHLAFDCFLVALQPSRQAPRPDSVQRGQRSVTVNATENGRLIITRQHVFHSAQQGGGTHPPGHRLSMQELRISSLSFQRMSERMAEVQDTPPVLLFLISRYNTGFDSYGI